MHLGKFTEKCMCGLTEVPHSLISCACCGLNRGRTMFHTKNQKDHQDFAVDLSKHTDIKSTCATSPSVADQKTPLMTMNTSIPIKMKYFKSCNSDVFKRTNKKSIEDFEKKESPDSEDDMMQTGLSDKKHLSSGNVSFLSLTRQNGQMPLTDNFEMSESSNSNHKTINSIRPGSNLPRDMEACSTKTRAFKRKLKSRVMPVVNSLCSSDSNDSCNEVRYHLSQEFASESLEGNTKTGTCKPEGLSMKGSSSTENMDHYSSDTEDYQDYFKMAQEQMGKRAKKGKIKKECDESKLSEDKTLYTSLKMKTAESASSLNSVIGDTCVPHSSFPGFGNYLEMTKVNGGLGNQQARASCNKRNHSEDNSLPGPSQDREMQNDDLTNKVLEICKAYVEGWSTTYTCTLCSQMFSNKEGLQDHMRYHLREDPQFCSLSKDKMDKSKKTWKPRAESQRLHRCHVCMKTLTRNWDLQRHIRTHSEPKGTVNFTCELCGSGFSDKANYKRHVKGHNEEKKHQCPFCPQLFARRWDLTRHFRIHTGEKEVFCEVCDQGFTRQWDLIRHMRIHTGERPHACHICGKAFIRRWDRDRHLNTHTGERPYQCSLCDKTFVEKTRLLIHEGKHNGRTPFTCHICKKEYLDEGNLTKHLMKHAEDKMYQCQFCPKEFTHKWILDKHARTHYRAFQRQMEKQIKQAGSKNKQDQMTGENGQGKILNKHCHDQTVLENGQEQSDSSCDSMRDHEQMEDDNFKVQN